MQRLEVSCAVRPLQWSLGVKGLSTSHEAALEAQLDMLTRTDPLETNSRVQHPVFVPTPGGGVGVGTY